ncbi:hypothetical protein J2851_003453 [Azospirillum rugosum]|uniref:Uncharacterized protein n=1 Tax=Azospirillum rugosum TaxID=416170 RepID=A0ABS4SM75_9PROT|nr:hypothetical protein [Azospirillum rugosum]MBP2293669.1 hypothetical protein [Azospirillum rugosum]MDQ0527214.1 hypothetical protein [Azospirillum rugosum]
MLHLPQDLPRLIEEHLPCTRQGDAPLVPVDQLHLQLGLQLLQLLAKGRLRDVAPRRRAMKMQLFGERDEGLEAPTIHAPVIEPPYQKLKAGSPMVENAPPSCVRRSLHRSY